MPIPLSQRAEKLGTEITNALEEQNAYIVITNQFAQKENKKMFERFIRDFKDTAKDDIRIFFAPYKGAYREIKAEACSPWLLYPHALVLKLVRLSIAPLIGAYKGIAAEFKRIGPDRN